MSALGPLVPHGATESGGIRAVTTMSFSGRVALIGDLHQELLILARRDLVEIIDPHAQPPGDGGVGGVGGGGPTGGAAAVISRQA